jgi:hypothetical protein
MRRQTRKKNGAEGTGKTPVKITRTYFASVAGVSYNNDDGSSRQTIISQCKPGEKLMLIREPDNRFDPAAIKVTRWNGHQIGYVPADIARNENSGGLAHEIDAGAEYRCRIAEVIGGEINFRDYRPPSQIRCMIGAPCGIEPAYLVSLGPRRNRQERETCSQT